MEGVGGKTILVTIVGYLTLVSYTWPLGFLPLISIQSLPVVLLAFALILFLILIGLGLLFLPFTVLSDEKFIRQILYSSDPGEDLSEKYEAKPIRIPVSDLFRDVAKECGKIMAVWRSLQIVVVLGIVIYLWNILAKVSGLTPAHLVLTPLVWIAYRSLSGIFREAPIGELKLPLTGVIVFFVVVPALFFGKSSGFGFGPNPFVNAALQISALGGGVPVRIISTDDQSEIWSRLPLRLLFYDGSRAWLKVCEQEGTKIVQVEVDGLVYLKDSLARSECGLFDEKST